MVRLGGMMMETVFVIFLAGCTHDMSLCESVDKWEVSAESKVACEAILDDRLMHNAAEWPVYMGSCELAGPTVAAPDWWPEQHVVADLSS